MQNGPPNRTAGVRPPSRRPLQTFLQPTETELSQTQAAMGEMLWQFKQLKHFRETNDQKRFLETRNQLAQQNLPLVWSIAHRYRAFLSPYHSTADPDAVVETLRLTASGFTVS